MQFLASAVFQFLFPFYFQCACYGTDYTEWEKEGEKKGKKKNVFVLLPKTNAGKDPY